MAGRQNKVGIDYFELDCHMDEKVELIEAEYGLKGFAILVKLYQSIYSGFGYYCEWTPDISVLWARRLGVSHGVDFGDVGKVDDSSCALPGFPNNLINNVVAALIRRKLFSEQLFKKYGILTSSGIQKQYLKATSRREIVELKKEYLLINVPKNSKNVVINSINVDGNSVNSYRTEHSKEKKSIYNICAAKRHDDESSNEEQKQQVSRDEQLRSDFEIIYGIYPKKRGKTVAFANYKLWVGKGKDVGGKKYKLTNRQIYKAVQKYIRQQEEAGQDDYQYWKNFDTLMGRQLLDYVDWEES